jgi:hypothetical protein
MKAKIEIKVKGHLDETWKEWFEGMDIRNEGEYTILTGQKKDDAFVLTGSLQKPSCSV